MYRCPPFDLDDQALIENARITGQPAHIAQAVEAAVAGFRQRVQAMPPPPVINGELVFTVCKPTNFFDYYCIALVIQEVCDSTRIGVALVKTDPPANQKRPASPDVEFT